ncbi:hypothetical protein Pd630_LPD09098 (plasmid) [Rhodococcus opacus PD630]|nr:hypothetical protein Pd630_LPD09098 [Rhodococcus opacus PD630]
MYRAQEASAVIELEGLIFVRYQQCVFVSAPDCVAGSRGSS